MVAVAMDGNNQIVSVAFGICKGETGPCWSWWMSVLKECIDDNPNLLFISDRHAAIALAVEKEFPLAFHAVCCRHLLMNLGLKNKKRKGAFTLSLEPVNETSHKILIRRRGQPYWTSENLDNQTLQYMFSWNAYDLIQQATNDTLATKKVKTPAIMLCGFQHQKGKLMVPKFC
nr:transposase, MuDR, MULE transposase domain protein [Tanacetum cinerariifolium]